MKIMRRLGSAYAGTLRCVSDTNCPAVFSLSTGDVAFIGAEASEDLKGQLPPDSGVGDGERLVVVPRAVLIDAGWVPPEN
jgi:hypothetical protein